MTEQMELLAANPFTYKINPCRISYTLEFKKLFLARYETGEGAREIFQSLGYDTELLGDGRICSFAYRLSRQADAGEVFTEAHPATKQDKPVCVDYNTMPAQQSVAAMQREISHLRQQLDFLKKLTELDSGKRSRT
ncbi:MAG: hypothetical protein LUE21_03650 [Oscillospiraceae bacterium]|nr:hypothetical protein [Oscillospiraceae bacterium]